MSGTTSISASDPAGLTVKRPGGLAANFDSFLLLLTKQLQNQDPLAPMDASKFTSQLVEFASVEQAIRSNTRLDQLVGSMQIGARTASLGYLGNRVTVDTALAPLGSTGGAQFAYELPSTARQALVRVVDAGGNVVRVLEGGRVAGSNTVTWDGKDTQETRQAAGLYHIEVEATDKSGHALAVATELEGHVRGVSSVGSQIVLDLGDRRVPVEAVTAVRAGSGS